MHNFSVFEEKGKLYIPEKHSLDNQTVSYGSDYIYVFDSCVVSTDPIIADVYSSDFTLLTRKVVDPTDMILSTSCDTANFPSSFTHSLEYSPNYAFNFVISSIILFLILFLPVRILLRFYRHV